MIVSWRLAQNVLVRGAILRRARARREAAASLDEANVIFEEIGAAVWAARARTEWERLGRHRPGTEVLTPSEQQVAELAAAGVTNREVAERLSITLGKQPAVSCRRGSAAHQQHSQSAAQGGAAFARPARA